MLILSIAEAFDGVAFTITIVFDTVLCHLRIQTRNQNPICSLKAFNGNMF